MRILHVIRDSERRGSQVFARHLADAMERLGHEVRVASLVDGDRRPGLDVEILGTKPEGAQALWALRRRMNDVDVTVAHGPVAGAACARVGGRSRPFVYRQVRDTRFWTTRRPAPPRRPPQFFRRAAAIVAMSSGARSDLLEILDLRDSSVEAIPLGVPLRDLHQPDAGERVEARHRLRLDPHRFVVITVGAVVAGKGIDMAIRAVSDLTEVDLVVVGDGAERGGLERLAAGLSPERVTFLGSVADVMGVYAAADLFLQPSVSGDSMPASLIEAGFCGLPSVASAIGSIDEVIDNGRTGLLVPPGDVEGLRSTIELMRVGRVGREQMGAAARERCIAHFEIEVVAKEWMDVLARVVAT